MAELAVVGRHATDVQQQESPILKHITFKVSCFRTYYNHLVSVI